MPRYTALKPFQDFWQGIPFWRSVQKERASLLLWLIKHLEIRDLVPGSGCEVQDSEIGPTGRAFIYRGGVHHNSSNRCAWPLLTALS